MTARIKLGTVVLCEHLVPGANNKPTLINVYSGDIIVAQMPATLIFGLFIELPEAYPKEIEFELFLDRKKFAEMRAHIPEGNKSQSAIIGIPLIQMGIDKDLVFSIVAKADGYANTTVVKRKIFKGDIPGISPSAASE